MSWLKKTVNKVAKETGLKKVAKQAGPELGAIIGTALGGPAGAAIGSAIGTSLGGGKAKDALKNAAIAGAMSYGANKAFGIGKSPTAGDGVFQFSDLVPGREMVDFTSASGAQGITNEKFLGIGSGKEGATNIFSGIFGGGAADAGSTAVEGSGILGGLKGTDILGLGSAALSAAGILGLGDEPETELTQPRAAQGQNYSYGFRDGRRFDMSNEEDKNAYIARLLELQTSDPRPAISFDMDEVEERRDGGIMNLSDEYFMSNPQPPTSGGMLVGPGTGKSDSIMAGIYDNMGNYEGPARLSDGEFVVTADAIKGLGDGDPQIGAARMYEMMASMERMA